MPLDALGQEHKRADATARIVCLVPSVTELLFALGLGSQLVGRTGFCIHPAPAVRAIAKCGGTKDVHLDTVRALRPSHVIVNIDENTRETFEALQRFVPHVVVTHPNHPDDNPVLYRLLGAIFGRDAAAEQLVGAYETARSLLGQRTAGLPSRRALYLIWREPWMTISADTYIGNMLSLGGYEVVPVKAGTRYPALDDAEIARAGAEICLLSSEPYPFRAQHLAEVQSLAGCEAQLVDGEMFSWYGNRAIDALDYLGRLACGQLGCAA
jgi:ABC-type Fe3+-hydroxamate transport system substrate-binding protein